MVSETEEKRWVGVLPSTSRIFGKVAYMSLERKVLAGGGKKEKGDGVEEIDCPQGGADSLPQNTKRARAKVFQTGFEVGAPLDNI
jgi:hypothetical protein